MNFIVSILMAVRSLTFMASFVSTDSSSVHFTAPQIVLTTEAAKITIGLENALTGELLKLASTGTTIPIYIYVDLIKAKGEIPAYRSILETRLNYDLANKRYCIIRSPGKDTLFRSTLDSAVHEAGTCEAFSIFPFNVLDKNEEYYINIYAILGKTTVEALGNNNMDLMYYWDFKRPSIRTEKYKGESFIIKRS